MARTDNDAWDLASSVGVTATMVAASRAMASKAERPLINDPFAEPLVRAVGVDLFVRLVSGELNPADLQDEKDGAAGSMPRMTDKVIGSILGLMLIVLSSAGQKLHRRLPTHERTIGVRRGQMAFRICGSCASDNARRRVKRGKLKRSEVP